MNKKAIKSKSVGPYSPAVLISNRLYVSGQIPLNTETGEILKSSIEEETALVLENIKSLAEKANFTMDDAVKTTIFLTNMEDFSQVNEEYAKYFREPFPARSTVEVSSLPKGVRVEIEGIFER